MIAIYIISAILVVIALWLVFTYNIFVRLTNRAKEAWADIDVQLKRRYDLVPNLVNTVKGYATHEAGTFEKVTVARAAAISAEQTGNPAKTAQAENALAETLKSLFAIAENYPDLKANQNFLELQRELSDTENKIQAARRFYNGNVRDLNTKIETFPANLVAGMFNVAKREFFELEETAVREAVEVKF